jgi:hypothetical protein
MIHINVSFSSIDFMDKNGSLHRIGGPAVIVNEKHQVWYVNGKLHREDGPAVIDGDFQKWYLNGEQYNEFDYYEKLKNYSENK